MTDVWKYKPYKCKAQCFDIEAGSLICVLNEEEAHENDIYTGDRIILKKNGKEFIVTVDLSSQLVKKGEVGLFSESVEKLKAKQGDPLEIKHTKRPASIEYIKGKMDGKVLKDNEISAIIQELMENKLSEVELATFITAMYIRGLTPSEVVGLTNAIVASGSTLDLGKHPIVDKHCSGGVAGNRTTMVLVPIIAAAGLYIPKTSSRSISSASGTADTMEVLAPVEFSIQEMREIVTKNYGCIVWGGAINLAAADDKLIKIRQPLRLDPKGVLLASILAKKKSVGAEFLAIDIPVGRGAKHQDLNEAKALAKDFLEIGSSLGIKVESFMTDGTDPIGFGIGPALECKDVLLTLQGKGPADLTDKSCLLAGALLELCGKVKKGEGYSAAQNLLTSGKALAKMRQIIEAQGGNPNVKIDDLPIGKYVYTVKAEKEGRISHVDNKTISKIARAAGAPKDKGAGVILHCEQGDKVKAGDILFEIVSESEAKLDFAIKALEEWPGVELQKVILGTISETSNSS